MLRDKRYQLIDSLTNLTPCLVEMIEMYKSPSWSLEELEFNVRNLIYDSFPSLYMRNIVMDYLSSTTLYPFQESYIQECIKIIQSSNTGIVTIPFSVGMGRFTILGTLWKRYFAHGKLLVFVSSRSSRNYIKNDLSKIAPCASSAIQIHCRRPKFNIIPRDYEKCSLILIESELQNKIIEYTSKCIHQTIVYVCTRNAISKFNVLQ